MPQITISIAAYNDADMLRALIQECVDVASSLTPDYQVLVIDDGSRDATPTILADLMRSTPRLAVHTHPRNMGFGVTIREAFCMPASEWVFFVAGDGQIPPSALLDLYPFASDYQYILGFRRERRDPLRRKIASWVYNVLISLLAGRRIYDTNGTALLQRNALEGIDLHSTSGFIHAEILLELLRTGARVHQAEISHRPRVYGTASGHRLAVIWATVLDLLAYAARRRRQDAAAQS